jgi:hypothetical protein
VTSAGPPSLEFAVSQARKDAVVQRLFRGLGSLLKGRGVQILAGPGDSIAGVPCRW